MTENVYLEICKPSEKSGLQTFDVWYNFNVLPLLSKQSESFFLAVSVQR